MEEELIKKAFTAIKNDDLNTLRQLEQQHKGVLYLQDSHGMTLLHEACKYDKDQIVGFLARRQVPFHIRTGPELGGNNALMIACTNGHLKAVTMLLAVLQKKPESFSVDDCNNLGDTALMIAAREGRTVIMKALLRSGARVHIVNGDGRNAALIAAEHRHYSAVQMLVECGVDPDFVPAHGHSLTHKAKKDAQLEDALVKAARHRNLVSSGLHVYADKSAASSIQQLSKEDILDFETRRQHCETKRQAMVGAAAQESKTVSSSSSSSSSSSGGSGSGNKPTSTTPTSTPAPSILSSAPTSPSTSASTLPPTSPAPTTATSPARLASPSSAAAHAHNPSTGLRGTSPARSPSPALFQRMRTPSDHPPHSGGGANAVRETATTVGATIAEGDEKRPHAPMKGREGREGRHSPHPTAGNSTGSTGSADGDHDHDHDHGSSGGVVDFMSTPTTSPLRSTSRPRSTGSSMASISISLSTVSTASTSSTSSSISPSSSISVSSETSSLHSSHSHSELSNSSPESTVVSLNHPPSS